MKPVVSSLRSLLTADDNHGDLSELSEMDGVYNEELTPEERKEAYSLTQEDIDDILSPDE